MKLKTKCVSLLLFLALVFLPLAPALAQNSAAQAANASGEEMMADLVLIRPAGIISTLVGSGLFIVALPFSALGGNVRASWNHLVSDPARFTFERPLGEF